MRNEKLTLNEAIKIINERIDDHIGSNGNAHLPVSKDRAGFESPKQFLKNIESAGTRTFLANGTDIFQLKPGKYWGLTLVNSPFDGSATQTVDITSINDMKQITLLVSYTGKYYKYTRHINDFGINENAPITWTTVERAETLWSGSASSTGTVLKLLDRPNKFSKIRLTIDNSNAQEEVRDFIPNQNKITVVVGNIFNSSPGMSQMKMILDIDSNANTVTISNNFSYGVTSGGISATADRINIYKIEGVI